MCKAALHYLLHLQSVQAHFSVGAGSADTGLVGLEPSEQAVTMAQPMNNKSSFFIKFS
jgi:hypothetical protein